MPEDHGNCSVGSYTHGMIPLEEAATHTDVGTLVEAGWVTPEMFPVIPAVTERPNFVTYGPLAESPIDPDVVLLRVNPKQLMVLSDALPGLRIEGKPQCHIVAIAKESGAPAASVGCILSRTRTGMPSTESTCALPGPALADIVERVEADRGDRRRRIGLRRRRRPPFRRRKLNPRLASRACSAN